MKKIPGQLSMVEIEADALFDFLYNEGKELFPEKSDPEIYQFMLNVILKAREILESQKTSMTSRN